MGINTNSGQVERNNYIDFLRGIAAINIVAIHTAFWGGQSYTPAWFWNITLLLDVPFFFYLSGWSSSYRHCDIVRTSKSLLNIWIKWIFFVIIVAAFCKMLVCYMPNIQGVNNIRDLVNNMVFNVSIPGLPVIAGSIWFMPHYFVVVLVNTMIVMMIEQQDNAAILKTTYMWLLLGVFVWVVFGQYVLGLDLRYFLFYSFFWMLGINNIGKTENLLKLLSMLIICIIGFTFWSYMQDLPIWDIQSAKFPPSIKYGFVSMASIFIARYFEPQINTSLITHIGKNAIWYYFAQGIGSSINYYVIEWVHIGVWPLKWCVTFMINLICTVLLAEFLAWIYGKNIMLIKKLIYYYRRFLHN